MAASTGLDFCNRIIFSILLILALAAYTSKSARLTKRQLYHQGHVPVPQGRFQSPQGHFQAPQGHFQAPQGHFQVPQGHFPVPQGRFQVPQGHFPVHGGVQYPGFAVAPPRPKPGKDEQDLSKVPGTPGVDYPLFHEVPPTRFLCDQVPAHPGIYANVETGCQAYHICHDGREGHQGASFLCPNGTLFNQHEFACDWWYNVNCADAPRLYNLNLDPEKNPYSPKPKKEEPEEHAPVPAPVSIPVHAPAAYTPQPQPQYYPHQK